MERTRLKDCAADTAAASAALVLASAACLAAASALSSADAAAAAACADKRVRTRGTEQPASGRIEHLCSSGRHHACNAVLSAATYSAKSF